MLDMLSGEQLPTNLLKRIPVGRQTHQAERNVEHLGLNVIGARY